MAVVIDDFEDGDITVVGADYSGWAGDTGAFSASSSSPISGSFSGLLASTGTTDNIVTVTRTTATTFGIAAEIRIESDLADGRTFLQFSDGATLLGSVEFDQDGDDILFEGASINTLQSFSAGTAYAVAIKPDFANDEATIDVDGTEYGPYALAASASDWDELDFRNSSIGADQDSTIDAVEERRVQPPTLSVTATRDTEVDLSASVGPDADAIDIYRAESAGVTTGDTLVTTLTGGTTTYTDSSLENGEQFHYTAEARDTDTDLADSGLGNEVSGTTTLPTPTINSTTAASATSIDVDYALPDNSTDGDVEILVDGSVVETRQPGDATETTVTGLSEGTSYDIEVRRNTDHVTETSAVSTQNTGPDAPTDLDTEIDNAPGTVLLTWTDNSSGEDNFEIEESSDGKATWTAVSTEAANTTQYTTSERDRLKTWHFRVRAVVGSGSDAAQSDWAVSAATTFRTYPGYWAVAHPVSDADAVVRRALESGPTYEHSALNHYTHTVPASDVATWTFGDIAVFLNDERLFRGEMLKRRDNQPRGQTQLTAFGPGLQLRRNAPTSIPVTYDAIPLSDAIEDYWTNQTDGVDVSATVHTPPRQTITDDVRVLSDETTTFGGLYTPADDEPIEITSSIDLLPVAYVGVQDDFSGGDGVVADVDGSPPYHIDGEYQDVETIAVSYSFTPQHDIPADRVGVAVHGDTTDSSGTTATLDLTLNSHEFGPESEIFTGLGSTNRWATFPDDYAAGDLSAGTSYTVTLDPGDFGFNIDALVVYDTKYGPYTFDDVESYLDKIDGPRPHKPVTIDLQDELRAYPIVEGRIESAWTDTTNGQTVALSNDGGSNFTSASNTTSLTADFKTADQWGERLVPRLTLDGHGSNSWLTDGATGQQVTELDVYLTTEDVPLVSSIELTGNHEENIQRLHRDAAMRFVIDPTVGPRDPVTVESFDPDDPAVVRQPTWTTLDDTQTERDALGYANAVTIVYNDANGDSQQFVKTADQSEVSRVNEEKRAVVPRTDVSTTDEARRAAVQEERKRIAEDTESGTLIAAAEAGVFAGYPYDVPAFGGVTSLDDTVEYSATADSREMTLRFVRAADPLERQLQTETDVAQLKRD